MEKKYIVFGASLILLIGGLVYWGMRDGKDTTRDTASLPTEGMVLYWGDGCPHCKKVEEYLETNHIAEKVNFTRKEVWHDRANAKEMERRAHACGVELSQMGVPFLYSNGKCFMGEPDVEKEFATQAGITPEAAPENGNTNQ